MLADPQSITVAGTAISLPRVGADKTSADYQSADGNSQLRVSQTGNGSTRNTVISLRTAKIAADPITAVNARKSQLITISFRGPIDGFSITELKDEFIGLTNALTASSAAVLLKALGGEK
jgi:hypothetical protein